LSSTIQSITARTVEELVAIVRDASQRDVPIVDYGVAHAGVGHAPPAEHIALQLAGGIVEHYERDMTVRVHAGMAVSDLKAALREKRQFLPIDADDDMTVGEVIAHNVFGPLRQSYGSVRDLLLGMHFIDGRGRDIHPGGRTVKNVAGYDLTRFMVGSLGEFGIIHQATLRTYAIPESALVIDLQVQAPKRVDSLLPRWLLTDGAPAWLDLSLTADGWRIRMGYLGRSTGCLAQLRSLETLLGIGDSGLHIVGSGETTFANVELELATRRRWMRTLPAVMKIVVPPASTGGTCNELHRWAHQQHERPCIDALPAHGVIWIGGNLDADSAGTLDAVARDITRSRGGFRVWHRWPAGSTLSPFDAMPAEWQTLAKVRRTLDPQCLFNRGRCLPTEEASS
jgi:hypothetical protein